MKKVIHLECDGGELILKLENVGIREIGVMIGDALEVVCSNDKMIGKNTKEDTKNVLVTIILSKLGYTSEDGDVYE